MGIMYNENSIAGLLWNGSAVSALYNGEIVWPTGSVGLYNVSLYGDPNIRAYASAFVAGDLYTSWTSDGLEIVGVPDGALLYVETNAKQYYRHSGISSNCSSFISGYRGDGALMSGSGYVTSDASATINNTGLNSFTATGNFQITGNDSGAWSPHKINYLSVAYDFAKGYISSIYSAQGAVGTWSYNTLGRTARLNSGVQFSSFSSYVSSYGNFSKVSQQRTAYCTAGLQILGRDSSTNGSFNKINGPYSRKQTANFSSATLTLGTSLTSQITIYSKVNWNGLAGDLASNGKWSATGIAP